LRWQLWLQWTQEWRYVAAAAASDAAAVAVNAVMVLAWEINRSVWIKKKKNLWLNKKECLLYLICLLYYILLYLIISYIF